MDATQAWRDMFQKWPANIPQEGIIVTTFGETIAFTGFMVSDGLLILDRDRPDSTGARKVIVAWAAINALKITSPLDLATFNSAGFRSVSA